MQTDYKISYFKKDSNGHIVECCAGFYEGDTITENGVAVYQRTKLLEKKVFKSDDFGLKMSDEKLRVFLSRELAKDKSRTPIEAQKIK